MFAGIVRFDDGPIASDIEDRLVSAIAARPSAHIEICRSKRALFVQRVASANNGGRRRVEDHSENNLFAGIARLDNREELSAALAIPAPDSERLADADLLQRMLERWGDDGVARCLGAFAFARWEADARRLTLGRDCLGNCPLLFHHGERFVAFANDLGALFALHEVPRQIDETALANFMVLNFGMPDRTLYRGINRVPGRTMVTFDGASVRRRHYWSPNLDAPPPYSRDEDYVERARELFDQAVAAAVSNAPNYAISLSGGLDSSAIAATAARLGGRERIACYTLVPPDDLQIKVSDGLYLDEGEKVRALARMHPSLEVRLVTPEVKNSFGSDQARRFIQTNVPQLGPVNRGWAESLGDIIEAGGHHATISGSRGNLCLTWDGRFSLLTLLRAGRIGAFWRELLAAGRTSGRGAMHTLASDVLFLGAPVGLRRQIHRLRGRNPDSAAHYSALNPDFSAEQDLPRQWREQDFDPWNRLTGTDSVRLRAQRLFDDQMGSRDGFTLYGGPRGVDIRHPFADRRLLEFALAVPEALYRRNGVPRSFARAVFADRLPREILDERRRGAQGPDWFRNLNASRQEIEMQIERMEASPTARRLLDIPRLKRLVDQWPANAQAAQSRKADYMLVLARGVHIGNFIRWVEGGNS